MLEHCFRSKERLSLCIYMARCALLYFRPALTEEIFHGFKLIKMHIYAYHYIQHTVLQRTLRYSIKKQRAALRNDQNNLVTAVLQCMLIH